MYRTGPPASPDETRQCSADKMTQIEVLAETLFYHAMSHRDLKIEFCFFGSDRSPMSHNVRSEITTFRCPEITTFGGSNLSRGLKLKVVLRVI